MKTLFVAAFAVVLSSCAAQAQLPNTLTKKEKNEGWTLLFDGKTTQGWHTYNKPALGDAWSAADGVLEFDPSKTGRGDITTDGEYENYELSLDWKIAENGNSGIIFGVHEDPKYQWSFLTGAEMQILDNERHSDNKLESHRAGSLYDLIPANTPCNPAGQWNNAKIRKVNGLLTLWLNGKQVVQVQMWDDAWKKLVAGSKFNSMPDWSTYKKGHIALQDHGDVVSFRNVKIKQL